jgi:hypothetical protein
MTTKEAVKPENAIATRVGARGLEGFDKKDLSLARISLLQGLSKAVTKGGKKAGTFINTLTSEELGTSVEFIPVAASKYFDLLKKDPTDPSKMTFEGRTHDENDVRLKGRHYFNDKALGIKADVNTVISYLVLLDGEPALLSFSKTSYKSGKKLGTLASLSGKDLFATKYKVSAKSESRNNNDYFVMEVDEVGEASVSDYKIAEMLYTRFGSRMNIIADKAPSEDGEAAHVDTTAEPSGSGVRQNPPEGTGAAADTFEETKAAEVPVFTKVRVLKEIRTDEDKKCAKCSEVRTLREGKVKTIDPETGLQWGKVKALACAPCKTVDIVEKLAD